MIPRASIYWERIPHSVGGELLPTFHPSLSWTYYRALIRVSDADARSFYEVEAVGANWSGRDLERQINSLYCQRLLASADKTGMLQSQRQPEQAARPIDVLKDPCVLEFLDLPNTPQLHETQLEDAIITGRRMTMTLRRPIATRLLVHAMPCRPGRLADSTTFNG